MENISNMNEEVRDFESLKEKYKQNQIDEAYKAMREAIQLCKVGLRDNPLFHVSNELKLKIFKLLEIPCLCLGNHVSKDVRYSLKKVDGDLED